jgi:hypothetical protein
MPSFDDIQETLNFANRTLWLFILAAGATLLTIQTVESAIETAWPHQRRMGGRLPGERRAVPVMGIVAILVLAGALLSLMTLGVMLWRDVAGTYNQRLGAVLLLAGWIAFMLASLNWFGFGRVVRETGMIGPLALCALLLVADVMLLVAFIDIVPEFGEVWDAIKEFIPFLSEEADPAAMGT